MRLIYLAILALVSGSSTLLDNPRTRWDAIPVAAHQQQALATILIDARPSVDLGGNRGNPDHELNQRATDHLAVRLADGRIVVADGDHLKIFSSRGEFLQRLGRAGQGPGEFGSLIALCAARGDTIVAADRSRRVVVFDRTGKHVRTFENERGNAVQHSCAGNGEFLAKIVQINPQSTLPPKSAELIDRVAELWRVNPAGAGVARVGIFPDGMLSPFIPSYGNYIVRNERIFVGSGKAPEVSVYTTAGSLVRVIKWQQQAIPVTDSILAISVRGSFPNEPSRTELISALERARSYAQPAEVPYYYRIGVDGLNRLWIQDHPFAKTAVLGWSVRDSTGTIVGRVPLPAIPGAAGMTIQSVGVDEVLLRWRDAEGFLHLAFHPVRSPR